MNTLSRRRQPGQRAIEPGSQRVDQFPDLRFGISFIIGRISRILGKPRGSGNPTVWPATVDRPLATRHTPLATGHSSPLALASGGCVPDNGCFVCFPLGGGRGEPGGTRAMGVCEPGQGGNAAAISNTFMCPGEPPRLSSAPCDQRSWSRAWTTGSA